MRRRPYHQMPPIEYAEPIEVSFPEEIIAETFEEYTEASPFDALVLYPLLCRQQQDHRALCELIQRLKDICPFLEPIQRRSMIRLIRMNDSLGRLGQDIARDYAMYRNDRPLTREERQKGIIHALSRNGENRGTNSMESMMDRFMTLQSTLRQTRGSKNPMDMMSLLGPLMNINGSNIAQMMNMARMMGNMNFD